MDAGRGGKWGRRHPLFHRHHPPWRSIIAAIGNRSTGQSSTMTICSFSSSGFSAQEICHATSSSIKSSSSSTSIRPIRRFHPHPGRGWRPRHSSIWFIHSIVFFSCNLTSPVRFKVIWRQWKRKKKKKHIKWRIRWCLDWPTIEQSGRREVRMVRKPEEEEARFR